MFHSIPRFSGDTFESAVEREMPQEIPQLKLSSLSSSDNSTTTSVSEIIYPYEDDYLSFPRFSEAESPLSECFQTYPLIESPFRKQVSQSTSSSFSSPLSKSSSELRSAYSPVPPARSLVQINKPQQIDSKATQKEKKTLSSYRADRGSLSQNYASLSDNSPPSLHISPDRSSERSLSSVHSLSTINASDAENY